MNILGISAFYHDSAAALVCDGVIKAAAQEERFTRKKHDACFPTQAVRYCLSEAGLTPRDVDHVVFYDKPFLKFERLIETYMAFAPRGLKSFKTAIPLWLHEKLFQKSILCNELKKFEPHIDWEVRLLFSEHHMSHAASAYFPSPFAQAVILTIDGVGEWATTSVTVGRGNDLTVLKEIYFPHSLGLLYSAFTSYLGFKVNSGEYKVMGLAPYGKPRFAQAILEKMIDVKTDGSFCLNLDYFDYCTGLRMTNKRFDSFFGAPARNPDDRLTSFHMDVAASIQQVLNEVVLRITRSLAQETQIPNLCLAGGVALNCVTNGHILRDGHFKNIWIQPAAGDAGGALGAALNAYYRLIKAPRTISKKDSMSGSFLGPTFSDDEIANRLVNCGARFTKLTESEMLDACVQILTNEKVLGWFQGRMEFGPRSLGARSILADPRSEKMQTSLNLKVKFRESFRPFAPAVLGEDLSEWFEINNETPYMLFVADVASSKRLKTSDEQEALFGIEKLRVPRSTIPAVTHVDGSARVQSVHTETNPLFHKLISRFKGQTGCPILVNTSFNVRGEPIVCTPEDAFRCFMGTNIDALAIGNQFLIKSKQDPELISDYRSKIEAD